jgi:hypothetical protein
MRGPAPAILRFATDSFMDEFHRVLETDPSKLTGLEAQFETWRGPGATAPAVEEPIETSSRLERKLARLRGSAERRLSLFGMSAGTALAERPLPVPGSPRPRLLKLYQPAHQRFYLVAAALVCRLPGLPDRTIDGGRDERARSCCGASARGPSAAKTCATNMASSLLRAADVDQDRAPTPRWRPAKIKPIALRRELPGRRGQEAAGAGRV